MGVKKVRIGAESSSGGSGGDGNAGGDRVDGRKELGLGRVRGGGSSSGEQVDGRKESKDARAGNR